MSEEDVAARNKETVQLEDSEDSATEEEDLGPIDHDPRLNKFGIAAPFLSAHTLLEHRLTATRYHTSDTGI